MRQIAVNRVDDEINAVAGICIDQLFDCARRDHLRVMSVLAPVLHAPISKVTPAASGAFVQAKTQL